MGAVDRGNSHGTYSGQAAGSKDESERRRAASYLIEVSAQRVMMPAIALLLVSNIIMCPLP